MDEYYKTLGLTTGATKSEIKKAYKRLAMKHHPDRNSGNAASEEMMKKINEAYAALMDPSSVKKKPETATGHTHGGFGKWDTRGTWEEFVDPIDGRIKRRQKGYSGSDFADMFSDLFSKRQKRYKQQFDINDDAFGKKGVAGGASSIDIEHSFVRTARELFEGTELQHVINRGIICTDCHGKVKVCHVCNADPARKHKCSACAGTGAEKCTKCDGLGYTMLSRDIKVMLNIRKIPVKISMGDDGKYHITLRFNGMGHQGYDGDTYGAVRFGGQVVTGDLYFHIRIEMGMDGVHFDSNGRIVHAVMISLSDLVSGTNRITAIDGKEYDVDVSRINKYDMAESVVAGAGYMKNDGVDLGDYVFRATVKMPDFSKLEDGDRQALVEILSKL